MKFLLILLFGLMMQFSVAGDKEFLELCNQVDELPEAQKTTMKSLIKIGSGIFTIDMKSCDEVLVELKKSKHLEMRGSTFEYIFVDSLFPITTLDWVESLSISNQKKVRDITPLKKMNLKSINIQGTSVVNLSQLDELSFLEKVWVTIKDHQSFTNLSKLKGLREIFLNFQNIGSINFNALEGLSQLHSLDIAVYGGGTSSFKLLSLDSLSHLKSLTVRGGHVDARELASIPLKTLILDDNRRTKISHIDHIGLIDGLEKLSLGRQGIQEIKFLKKLENLRVLNLSYNKISSAKDVSNLIMLEELDMSFNELWMDSEFTNLLNLKKLNLFENNFSFFRATTFSKLKSLNLGYNHLHEVTFGHHPFLKEVILNNNQFRSHLVKTMVGSSLPVIKVLNLSSNKMTALKEIGTLTTLERLELDDNKITSIVELSGLKNLKRMSARYNLLSKKDQICPVKEKNVCDFLHQET